MIMRNNTMNDVPAEFSAFNGLTANERQALSAEWARSQKWLTSIRETDASAVDKNVAEGWLCGGESIRRMHHYIQKQCDYSTLCQINPTLEWSDGAAWLEISNQEQALAAERLAETAVSKYFDIKVAHGQKSKFQKPGFKLFVLFNKELRNDPVSVVLAAQTKDSYDELSWPTKGMVCGSRSASVYLEYSSDIDALAAAENLEIQPNHMGQQLEQAEDTFSLGM